MAFDLELYQRHVIVPFVPTLGLVHPDALSPSVIGALKAAQDGAFLPYDKEARWGGIKNERLLKEHIVQTDHETLIPTYQDSLIRLYLYGDANQDSVTYKKLLSDLTATYPSARLIVTSFTNEKDAHSSSIAFMVDSSYISAATGAQMEELNNPDLRDCFQLEKLADNDSDNSGFVFLAERVRQGHSDGDIFVSRSDQEIVGAVGPLRIMRDAANLLTRYPVYYGISKANRRQGRGSQLWDSALLWAKRNGVQYIVLQARAGSPAEAFYKYIGITPIGAIKRHATQLHT